MNCRKLLNKMVSWEFCSIYRFHLFLFNQVKMNNGTFHFISFLPKSTVIEDLKNNPMRFRWTRDVTECDVDISLNITMSQLPRNKMVRKIFMVKEPEKQLSRKHCTRSQKICITTGPKDLSLTFIRFSIGIILKREKRLERKL